MAVDIITLQEVSAFLTVQFVILDYCAFNKVQKDAYDDWFRPTLFVLIFSKQYFIRLLPDGFVGLAGVLNDSIDNFFNQLIGLANSAAVHVLFRCIYWSILALILWQFGAGFAPKILYLI